MGHFGARYMVNSIQATGQTWPDMLEQAQKIVDNCRACQQYNTTREGFHPAQTTDATFPLDHVAIDCATLHCTSNGAVYVLIMVDYFTKFVFIRALSDKKMTTIANALWLIFADFGLPKIIQSDNGSEFVNSLIKELVLATKMDHHLTTPYYPQANGRVERKVRVVLNTIKKQLEGHNANWSKYVAVTQLAINLQISASTSASPFTLMFGRPFAGLSDFRHAKVEDLSPESRLQYLTKIQDIVYPAIVQTNTRLAQQRKTYLDSNRKQIQSHIPPGVEVLLRNEYKTSKLDPLFVGPLTVVRCTKSGSYTLRNADGSILPRDVPPSKLKVLSDLYHIEDNCYEVDAIINHRTSKGRKEYLVRWKGYTSDYDTWEQTSSFDDITTIQKYWQRAGKAQN
jgi:hypothetical protein